MTERASVRMAAMEKAFNSMPRSSRASLGWPLSSMRMQVLSVARSMMMDHFKLG
jgi:hypothetical protein